MNTTDTLSKKIVRNNVFSALLGAVIPFTSVFAAEFDDAHVLFFPTKHSKKAPYNRGVYMSSLKTGKITKIWDTTPRETGAYLSRDGRTVAVNYAGKLYIMDNDGSHIEEHEPPHWPPANWSNWQYTDMGILWPTEGALHRYQPETKKYTTLIKNSLFTDNDLYLSNNAVRGYHNKKSFELAGDLTGMKTRDLCPAWKNFGRLPKGKGVWGHGMCMGPRGTYIFLNNWCCSGLSTDACPSNKNTGHNYIGVYNHVENSFVTMRCAASICTLQTKMHYCPQTVVNSSDYVLTVHSGSIYADENVKVYLFNWKDMSKSVRINNPYKHIPSSGWIGPLPSPRADRPRLTCDSPEITIAGPQTPARVTITNTGKKGLGVVDIEKSGANHGWLVLATTGNNTDRIVISHTVRSLLDDGEYRATVTVSGGGAANSVSYEVRYVKGMVLASPSGLRAELVGENADGVLLAWKDNSSGETGFSIERREDKGEWRQIATSAPDATTYTDRERAPMKYWYRVRAAGNDTFSAYSDPVSIVVIGSPMLTITAPADGATVEPGGTIALRWNANLVNNVKISYSLDSGRSWNEVTQTGGIRSGDDDWGDYRWTIPPGAAGEVRLKITQYSDERTYDIVVLAAGDVATEQILRCTAAPGSGGRVTVYSLKGRKLVSLPAPVGFPPAKHLPAHGVFIVRNSPDMARTGVRFYVR